MESPVARVGGAFGPGLCCDGGASPACTPVSGTGNVDASLTLLGMENLTPAIMLFLACSPDSQQCREMQHSEIYASVAECRTELPRMLRNLRQKGQAAIGRCASAAAQIDSIETGSVTPGQQHTTVRVTRIEHGHPIVSLYRVPKS
jgi:hypothetical protein